MRSVISVGRFDLNQLIAAFILNIIYLILAILFLKAMYAKALQLGKLIKLN